MSKKISHDEVPNYVGKNALIVDSYTSGKYRNHFHYSYYYGTITKTYCRSSGCSTIRVVEMNYIAIGGEGNQDKQCNGLTDLSEVFVEG